MCLKRNISEIVILIAMFIGLVRNGGEFGVNLLIDKYDLIY